MGPLRIAKPAGIPIYLHFSWLVLFGLIGWTLAQGYFPSQEPGLSSASYWALGLAASGLLMFSILLHELGHAFVSRRRGLQIHSITLFIFGGVARLKRDPEDGRTELQVAIAGPLVSFALAAAFALAAVVSRPPAPVHLVARYLAFINLGVGVFNLVPAFPLDGGRILRALLWERLGKARATRAAASAGALFASFLMVLGILALLRGGSIAGIWYLLMGWFLHDASASAHTQARLDEVLSGVAVHDAMLTHVETLPADISVTEAAQAYFLHTGYGSYPVQRGEATVGLLCLRDVLRIPPLERGGQSVQALMKPVSQELVVSADEPLLVAIAKMAENDAKRLLVMQDGRLQGLLTMSSVLRHIRVRQELAP